MTAFIVNLGDDDLIVIAQTAHEAIDRAIQHYNADEDAEPDNPTTIDELRSVQVLYGEVLLP